ncbi:cobyrinic acid a,c-diamide synthase [Haloechinothrix salitolerans]|uniref:Cobyrinic acid a,c-diamide synthase n=1 Tax=Haloechinothrix salitolerans TaxID=926830 RepID=A0ABW2C0V3_9PSEU
MTRRVSLPGATELFFRTTAPSESSGTDSSGGSTGKTAPAPRGNEEGSATDRRAAPRKKHDSKITVYLSSEQLLALEQARLALRATHDLAVDRGRLVREAVAVMLEDFEVNGEDSVLVRRLRIEEDEHGAQARLG